MAASTVTAVYRKKEVKKQNKQKTHTPQEREKHILIHRQVQTHTHVHTIIREIRRPHTQREKEGKRGQHNTEHHRETSSANMMSRVRESSRDSRPMKGAAAAANQRTQEFHPNTTRENLHASQQEGHSKCKAKANAKKKTQNKNTTHDTKEGHTTYPKRVRTRPGERQRTPSYRQKQVSQEGNRRETAWGSR
jgi:hypothetical protein